MRLILFSFLVLILVSCGGSRKLSNRNIAHVYSPGINFIFPDFKSYNYSPDSVRVFFGFNADELLLMKDDSTQTFKSSFSVSYTLMQGYQSKLPLDTGTRFYSYLHETDRDNGRIFNHFDIRCADSADYVLEIVVTDIHRQQAVASYLKIDRTGIQSPDNFILYEVQSSTPFVTNYSDRPVKVKLLNNGKDPGKIYVRYFRNDFRLSPPPFSDADQQPLSYVADSTVLKDLSVDNELLLKKTGIYHFQYDTMIQEGFTFFRFDEDFPFLTTADGLIESIRYVTTRQEFDKINASSDKKQAVDNYWLTMAGNRDRARALIKSYYSRVQFANRTFTSYLEGWKSDRGIIYIIFGPPASVYRTDNSETWSYSQNSYSGSLMFTFDWMKNPFTSNDYKLRRSAYYEVPWYRAVDSWRDGRVVNDSY